MHKYIQYRVHRSAGSSTHIHMQYVHMNVSHLVQNNTIRLKWSQRILVDIMYCPFFFGLK